MGNKSWNTGIWKRKLGSIANATIRCAVGNISAQTRCKLVLSMRNGTSKGFGLKCIGGFFPFEEALGHHIRESLAIGNAGIGVTFYGNPYVKDLLQGLNSRHHWVYHMKLTMILRCICTVQSTEVS